ncbi:MAG: acyl-CoA dehydrogenase family protein [Deltaproteobacteria bacterium]|nr:acyl-CoA dehydrogenase family protein [Deltaproteobacteria bacterium]
MFEFTEEQKMAQRMLRMWCKKELEPLVPAMEKGELLPFDTMRKLGETFGLRGIVEARFARLEEKAKAAGASGGGGEAEDKGAFGDAGMLAVLVIELSRLSPGFAMSFGAWLGLTGGAIMAKGTYAQKVRWGKPLLSMEKIGAWAITEPQSGSDAFSGMRTMARRDGDHYVLNGQKTFITNAPFADTFVVYAKLDVEEEKRPIEERPIHAFVLEKGTPGLAVSKPMEKMGMHTSPTGEVFLADARVPKDQLLGETEASQSREGARDVFHSERTGIAPMALGIIERCLEDSVRYAKERKTWGRAIAEYQLTQEKLARMFVHRENVRNMVFRELWAAKTKTKIPMAEACACKLYAARAATEVAMEAVQLMGGNGYMREFCVEQLARDAKLLQIGGGTDEIQIVTIARELLRE